MMQDTDHSGVAHEGQGFPASYYKMARRARGTTKNALNGDYLKIMSDYNKVRKDYGWPKLAIEPWMPRPCSSPFHGPPMHMYLRPGEEYVHTCNVCGSTRTITGGGCVY